MTEGLYPGSNSFKNETWAWWKRQRKGRNDEKEAKSTNGLHDDDDMIINNFEETRSMPKVLPGWVRKDDVTSMVDSYMSDERQYPLHGSFEALRTPSG